MAQRRKKSGDCYEAVARLLLLWASDGTLEDFEKHSPPRIARIAHGTVWHKETGWHGHAWVEVENALDPLFGEGGFSTTLVYDKLNGHDVTMPVDCYYALGRVRNVRRYDLEQARRWMVRSRHFGPWEGERDENRLRG